MQALIAVEDSRFYQHRGIDFIRLGKAIIVNIKSRSKAQGASTITQQLARNLYLTLEKQYTRKIKEAIIALQLEQHLSKDEILELYINQVYTGHGLYGLQNAAQFYYGKDAQELTPAQSTMLAGIIQLPEVYSPVKNFAAGRKRQKIVLNRMVAVGDLTEEQAAAIYAREDEVRPVEARPQEVSAGYVRAAIINYLENNYLNGAQYAYKGGLLIQTTINRQLQLAAEQAVAAGMQDLAKRGILRQDSNGNVIADVALVALDPRTGQIKAMVGGKNYQQSSFNRVYAQRPPGSTFKPFVYAEALRQGKITLATPILCAPVQLEVPGQKPWEPKDFGGTFHNEELTIRQAIIESDNVIAAKVMADVGPEKVVQLASGMGIPLQSKDAVLSLALGTRDVSPMDMAVGFAAFANRGMRMQSLLISSIHDQQDNIWETNTSPEPTRVLDERIAWLITDTLKQVITEGTGRPILQWYNDPRAAAKTGTTGTGTTGAGGTINSAWVAGYTPDLVTVVYIGSDEYTQPISNNPNVGGGGLAGNIWGRFMAKAQQAIPRTAEEPMPEGIIQVDICTASGEQATFRCPRQLRRREYFLQEFAPETNCSEHGSSWFDQQEGRPWWENFFPDLWQRP